MAWEDLPGDRPAIEANVARILTRIARDSSARDTPTIALAQQWHRDVYEGASPPPFPYYAGEVRDSDPRFPDLIDYEVEIGPSRGVPAAAVPAALQAFERSIQNATATIDAAIPIGSAPSGPPALLGVIQLCATAHGEWARIHPFANGNGRTARLWANWVALRYGLPPFVRIKPRPAGDPYAFGARASMQGQHQVMVAVFQQMLRDHLGATP